MKKQVLIGVLALIVSLILSSCSDQVNTPDDPSGKIKTGERQELPSKSIGGGGGTITFGDEANELKGMTIKIPQNSYDKSRTFSVSYAEIKSHSFGDRFDPISPLIRISNGGGYSEKVINISIPADIPEGYVAAAFYFNDKTGELEPLPVIKYSGAAVSIAVRHFSTSGMNLPRTKKITMPEILVDELYSHIVLSKVKEEDLVAKGLLTSGFEPGVDDWEFTNWGSVVTPEGNCAGHALTSMWYYTAKKKAGAKGIYQLYDKFDKSQKPDPFWEDNPKGMKIVSVAQKEQDLYWKKLLNDFYATVRAEYNDSPLFFDAYSREGIKAAAAQIFVTGEPMFTIVSTDEGGTSSHAVVAYSVDYVGGKIYVADPNFPSAKGRYIEFADGKFKTYLSGANASAPNNTSYKYFAFFGKSALFNWDNIAFNWAELENGTIGNKIFPKVEYFTYDSDGNEVELPDNIPYNADEPIKIVCKIDAKGVSLNDVYISLYRNGVELVRSDKGNTSISYFLDAEEKNTTFGIYVWDLKSDNSVAWVDFRWLKVQDLTIDPLNLNGEKNKEYTWKAVIINPPPNARYEWIFGDNSPTVKIKNNKEVKHTFKEDGIYPIVLQLYDDSNNQLFGVAATYAIIGAGVYDTTYPFVLTTYYTEPRPTFEVKLKGIIAANELRQAYKQSSPTMFPPLFYSYWAKSPTDVNVELNFDVRYTSGTITENWGVQYGNYKSEYEFEVLKTGFTLFKDTTKTFESMEGYRCDSTGTRFILKGKMVKVGAQKTGSMIIAIKYKRKTTEYYREENGSEYTEVKISEEFWPIFGFALIFN